MAVLSSSASSGERGCSSPTNSENEGTDVRESLKYVGRRFGAVVIVGDGSPCAVARARV
jgi:hypothetical protein